MKQAPTRLVAIAALAVLLPLGSVVSPLALATMVTLVLATVAGWTREIISTPAQPTDGLIRSSRPGHGLPKESSG